MLSLSFIVETSFCYPFVIPDEFANCPLYLCEELSWDFDGDCIEYVDCFWQSCVNLLPFILELLGVLSSYSCMLSPDSFWPLRAMSFPLRSAFIVSHKFEYVVAYFSLNSKKSLISFFPSSLTKLSLSGALFSFHVYVCFPLFLLEFKTSLSPW